MDAQQIHIHCIYSEDTCTDISSIVLESFRIFLQAELPSMDIPNLGEGNAEK